MKILIVEDEFPAAKRLAKLILELEPKAEIMEMLDSIESTVKWLKSNPKPELLFLDIHLADGNSFLIFEQAEVRCPVVFATAYDEYAIKAFKVNSIDYLLKPIEKDSLAQALAKFKNSRPNETIDFHALLSSLQAEKKEYKTRFLVRISDRLLPIHINDIQYFVAEEKLVFLQTSSQKYPIDFTLDQLESVLNPKLFFRINRKFLAQLTCIHKIYNHLNGKLKLILQPEHQDEIFVSREKAGEFKLWLEG